MASFGYTGAQQTYVVPGGVTQLIVECYGSAGNNGGRPAPGGPGGYVKATIPVTPGETLYLYVGNRAGYNGGGSSSNDPSKFSGGGMTDVRRGGTGTGNIVVVAGGGGSSGPYGDAGGQGGAGGNPGGAGGTPGNGGVPGQGATQVGGGAGGNGTAGGTAGGAGTAFQGGLGNTTSGGGGGGGYYGGGGAYFGAGGGGGSSWAEATAFNVTYLNGVQAGDGLIILTVPAPATPTLKGPASGTYQDVTGGVTLSWAYVQSGSGTTQTGWQARRRIGAGAYSYWNGTDWSSSTPVTNSGSTQSALTTGWVNGNAYSWSIASVDSGGVSAFPADWILNATATPTVAVTGPTGTIGASPIVTVTWTQTVAPGTAATARRVVIHNATQYGAGGFVPGVGPSVWDSGLLAGSAASATTPTLPNDTYRAYVQVTQTGGQSSAWAYSAFVMAMVLPPTPSIAALFDAIHGRTQLTVSEPFANLLTANQSSLETDGSGWSSLANCTVARSTAQHLNGAASLAITAVASGGTAAIADPQPVVGGQAYTATAWYRAGTVSRQCALTLWFFSASNVELSGGPASVLVTDVTSGWIRCSLTFVAPAGSVVCNVITGVQGCGAGEVHYVDQISLSPYAATPNLLSAEDASFEGGTVGGWSNGDGGALVNTTAQAVSGTHALQTTIGGSGSAVTMFEISPWMPVVAGQQYTAVGSMRAATTPLSALFIIKWVTAAGADNGQSGSSTVNSVTSGWTAAAVTAVAPAGTAFAYLLWYSPANATAGQVYYFDQMSLAPGSSTVWTAGYPTWQLGVGALNFSVQSSDDAGATWQPVRNGTNVPLTGGVASIFDYEAPTSTYANILDAATAGTRDPTQWISRNGGSVALGPDGASIAASTIAGGGYSSGFNSSHEFPVVPGAVYSLYAEVSSAVTVGRNLEIDVSYFDINNAYLGGGGGGHAIAPVGSWATLSPITITVPSNAYYLQVIVYITDAVGMGEVYYLRNVAVTAGVSPVWTPGGSVIRRYRAAALSSFGVPSAWTPVVPVVATYTGYWLKDPLNPALNIFLPWVTAPDDKRTPIVEQLVVKRAWGRRLAVVLSDTVMSGREGTLTVRTLTQADYEALRVILSEQRVLFLNRPQDSLYIRRTSNAPAPFVAGANAGSPFRETTFSYVEQAAP